MAGEVTRATKKCVTARERRRSDWRKYRSKMEGVIEALKKVGARKKMSECPKMPERLERVIEKISRMAKKLERRYKEFKVTKKELRDIKNVRF